MLLYQTLLYMPAQFLGPAFQFIAAVVWTHWLLPREYGVLAFVIAAQEFVFLVSLAWWTHYTMRFLPTLDTEAERARYRAVDSTIVWLTSLAQAFVAFLTLAAIDAPLTPDLIAATIAFTVSRSVTGHLAERGRARGDIIAYTVVTIANSVFGFAFAFVAVTTITATSSAALAGFALAQILALAWLAKRMSLRLSIRRPEAAILTAALRYGLPVVLAGCLGWVSVNGIRIVVQHAAGAEAVGLISVGWGLGQRIASVGAMLVSAAAFPIAVRALHAGGRRESLRQLSLNAALLCAFILPMAVGLLLVSRPLVNLMIAAPFRPVTLAILPLAVVAGVVRNLRLHYGDQIFLLLERTRMLVWTNGIEAIAAVAFCAIGVVYWGLPGAAAGCLAGTTLATVLSFFIATRNHGLELPMGHVGRIVFATIVMAIALALPTWPAGGGGLALEIAAGMLVYAGSLALLYPSEIRRGCRRVLALS